MAENPRLDLSRGGRGTKICLLTIARDNFILFILYL